VASVGRLRVLIAPDSFKGSLSSVDVARGLAEGWARARPGDELVLAPLADGGEGTLAAIAESGGWEWRECPAHDPLGRPLTARWLRSIDGSRGAVELAEASGLSRLPRDEPRNPVAATTEGTGEILRAVLDAGVRHVMIGVGGSATTDGGAGLLRGLGARFGSSSTGPDTPNGFGTSAGRLPGPFPDLTSVDLSGLDPRLGEVELRIACDVTNPLLGEQGAAVVYGPQKGATPTMVKHLDRSLTRLAMLTGTEEAAGTPGAGASGGLGYGLIAFLPQAHLVPGFDLIAGAAKLAQRLKGCTLCLTGEGALDNSSASGKTVAGVARLCRQAGVPCIALAGAVSGDLSALYDHGLTAAFAIADGPMTLKESQRRAKELLTGAAEAIVRIYS